MENLGEINRLSAQLLVAKRDLAIIDAAELVMVTITPKLMPPLTELRISLMALQTEPELDSVFRVTVANIRNHYQAAAEKLEAQLVKLGVEL